MQSALPFVWTLDKNVCCLGILMWSGIILIPTPNLTIETEHDYVPKITIQSKPLSVIEDKTAISPSLTQDVEAFTREHLLEKKSTQARVRSIEAVTEQVLKTAHEWLGTPYRYGGTTRDGVDCSAFVKNVFKQNGIELPRNSQEQFRSGIGIPLAQLKPGDLVFFSTSGPGASHVGIYLGKNEFVSATRNRVEVQSLQDSYWNRSYRGSRRVLQ